MNHLRRSGIDGILTDQDYGLAEMLILRDRPGAIKEDMEQR